MGNPNWSVSQLQIVTLFPIGVCSSWQLLIPSDDWRLPSDDDDAPGSINVCTHYLIILDGLWFSLIFFGVSALNLCVLQFLFSIILSCQNTQQEERGISLVAINGEVYL